MGLRECVFLSPILVLLVVHFLVACAPVSESTSAPEPAHTTVVPDFHNDDLGCGWEPTGSMELRYARCFTVDYFEGGYALACVADGNRYLMTPADGQVPDGLAPDIQVLHKPAHDVYLAASDTLCLLDALDALDCVSVSGIERDDWYLPAAREAMDEGRIVYGGKYRAPDYELLVSRGVTLSIQSTMINHTPAVREKLIELDIPVLTELSSYESDPLGRAEWIRLYGELLDKDEQAQATFAEQVARVASIEAEQTGRTVAFFYLNANGAAVVRRPGDYVSTMIERAGGTYVFAGLEAARAGASSMTLEMERFYSIAKDADVLIYNATIDDSVGSLDELLQKNELLADFAAVQNGEVWVCDQNMYQQMIAAGDMIADINRALHGTDEGMVFLRRLA